MKLEDMTEEVKETMLNNWDLDWCHGCEDYKYPEEMSAEERCDNCTQSGADALYDAWKHGDI